MGQIGVFPVHNNIFKIGLKGRASVGVDFVTIKDLETFTPSIDANTVEWTPMDQAGWKRRAVTGKGLSFSFSGKRHYGDPGNDYVAQLLLATGQAVESIMQWWAPDGSFLQMDCVLNLSTPAGGGATDMDALEFECMSDGLPLYTPTSTALSFVTVDGSLTGKTKIATVSPTLTGGSSYKYALNGSAPVIGSNATAWGTAYTLNADITAVENDTIYLAEVTAGGIIAKLGASHCNVKP